MSLLSGFRGELPKSLLNFKLVIVPFNGINERKSEIVLEAIENLLDQAEIPSNLTECGVLDDDRNGFYSFAGQVKAAFDFNPVSFNIDELDKILL